MYIKKIRGLMSEHGDTQSELAEKLGISKQTLNYKLMGRHDMSIQMLTRIAELYGVTIEYFF